MTAKKSIRIGISSCLMGNNVRYDGGHKLDHYLRDTLGQLIEWVPICPEAECGLSIPREPMGLVGDPDSPRLVTRDTGIDHTDRMLRWAQKRLAALEAECLCGFVFKARSPSCGVHDAKLSAQSGKPVGNRAGLFAESVMARFPRMPVQDEEGLHDPTAQEKFIRQAFAYSRRQALMADEDSDGLSID